MPDLEEGLGNRVARVDVDDLDVERQRDTLSILGDVLAEKLALHPVRALSRLGSQDAGVVASEEDGRIGVDSDACQVGLVRCREDAVEVTGAEIRSLCTVRQ